ncbi:MAG: NAD-binding protein [Microcystis sp. LE18-22.4A]|jgi:voltage-gated potassium channel Kch|uniref:potassium channel family protein n=1 Tax=Microcystis sp. LE18-22.4A TaxID=3016432 RepID=UPI0022BC1CD3|nr:NAD(P)-binding protein [Microcystis sp. LE18-22.4A]MCZ8117524.1 NAD-binding protein [Microcystis sp. LE18-22.4A]
MQSSLKRIIKAFSDRQMNKEMESLENHVIICVFGRIGRILRTKLAKTAQSFIIVDNNPDHIGLAQEKGYLTLNGNATDESILQKAGIDKARVLATVLPDDALNVFISNVGAMFLILPVVMLCVEKCAIGGLLGRIFTQKKVELFWN